MLLSNIIYLKVINNKSEGYGSGFVGLYYWGELNGLISVLIKVLFYSVMCNYSRFWKTIHAISKIYI